jgi:serine/threonine-protein kinase HipA
MARMLDVYLLGNFVGQLSQNDRGEMGFLYAPKWFENPQAVPLSQSLPLQDRPFLNPDCHGFFGGILPEEAKRERIAKNLGISKKNDFAMLAEIGGECAGAVTFMSAGQSLATPDYRALSEQELAEILRDLPKRPLLAGKEGIRLSLAGAQDKITVHRSNDGFAIPMNGAPSTHILKPAFERYENTVLNEAVCMRLAKTSGLPVADVEILEIEGMQVLSVERYDRLLHEDGTVKRLHQEDFCQALGIVSEMKYQSEGGVSLKQVFDLLRSVSSVPVIDLRHLLNVVIFNYLIGNNDAHGKNFSLLYNDGKIRLAPFYDLLCTVFYPELATKMAMKIGGKYEPDEVHARHFEKLADEAGLSKPMVLKQVAVVADKVLSAISDVEADLPNSAKLIAFICERVNRLKGRVI